MHATSATPVKTLAITNHFDLILLKQSQHYSVINTELINRLKVQPNSHTELIITSNKSEELISAQILSTLSDPARFHPSYNLLRFLSLGKPP